MACIHLSVWLGVLKRKAVCFRWEKVQLKIAGYRSKFYCASAVIPVTELQRACL